MSTSRRIILSVIAIALALLALLGMFDEIGKRYTEDSFDRALVTFGVSRGLNAVISVAQGTEVAMEPAGVGLIFTPGQILDPVNDLVERFSWVMLASTTSLGVQGLLLKVFASPGFSILLVVALLCALALVWWRRPVSGMTRSVVFRLAAFLLILRFVIPVMAIANEGFYTVFLESEYQASTAQLVETKDTIGLLNEQSRVAEQEVENLSWYESLRGDIQGILDSMDVDKHVQMLQLAAENLTEHTINLIVVFSVQTILFPLLFLWLTLKAFKLVFRLRWDSSRQGE